MGSENFSFFGTGGGAFQVLNDTETDKLDFVAHVIIMPVILALGVFGQILNLFTLSHKTLKGSCFVYLKSVALAELLSVFFLIPFVVRHAIKWTSPDDEHVRPYWILWYEAHLEIPLINSFVAANSLSITALTFERYISICHPVFARGWFATKIKANIVVVVIFILSLITFIPSCFQKLVITTYFGNGYNETEIVRNRELHKAPTFRVYLVSREILIRIGPIITVIVLNSLIVLAFRRATKNHNKLVNVRNVAESTLNDQNLDSNLSKSAGKEIVKRKDLYDKQGRFYILLTVTVITFLICTLPASILSLMVAEETTAESSFEFQVFRAAANLLEVFSFCINFYIYCMCSNDYRLAFLEKVGYFQRHRRQNNNLPAVDSAPTYL